MNDVAIVGTESQGYYLSRDGRALTGRVGTLAEAEAMRARRFRPAAGYVAEPEAVGWRVVQVAADGARRVVEGGLTKKGAENRCRSYAAGRLLPFPDEVRSQDLGPVDPAAFADIRGSRRTRIRGGW
jgi:hypothetical protein